MCSVFLYVRFLALLFPAGFHPKLARFGLIRGTPVLPTFARKLSEFILRILWQGREPGGRLEWAFHGDFFSVASPHFMLMQTFINPDQGQE
jgi:hypothetical protein